MNEKLKAEEVKNQIEKIRADGFNMYALMAEVRKKCKSPKLFFPDEVILKVCDQYWFQRTQIRKRFPWFVKVLYMEWCAYNARGYERMSQHNKNSPDNRGGCASIGAILNGLGIKPNED